ncbi:hypothetical protein RHGRI_004980 [Rhododendron griersonianum]|uniref:DUF4283 domain-containing protein n=1 Tax=Rhododendron griersonianum TaxID=479676 RepID=A0AAV6LAK7_9ERIC|nr:hypothetical protein RHGRI_004980 [Rhododendron griersonianum]
MKVKSQFRKEGKSYADVLKDKGAGLQKDKGTGLQKSKWVVAKNLSIRLKEIGNEWLHRSIVAKLIPMRSIALFQDQLKTLGYLNIEVRPMGGDFIVLTLSSVEVRDASLKNDELWFKDWYIEFQRWEETKQIQPSRLIWLNYYGLPLHLWNSNSFSALGQKWGNVVQISEETVKGFSYVVGKEVVLQSRGRDQAGGNKDDDFICDEEDESMDEQSDEEEDMISTDTEVDHK